MARVKQETMERQFPRRVSGHHVRVKALRSSAKESEWGLEAGLGGPQRDKAEQRSGMSATEKSGAALGGERGGEVRSGAQEGARLGG